MLNCVYLLLVENAIRFVFWKQTHRHKSHVLCRLVATLKRQTHFFLSFCFVIDLKRRRRRQQRWKWKKKKKNDQAQMSFECNFMFICFALLWMMCILIYIFFFLPIQLTALICHLSCTSNLAHLFVSERASITATVAVAAAAAGLHAINADVSLTVVFNCKGSTIP